MRNKIKHSPFTLNQTWKYCLAMWKWIAKNYVEGINSIALLKKQWLEENGFEHIIASCFFCDYCDRRKDKNCKVSCPGVKVAPRFDCFYSAYNYETKPKKFYQKLLRMDKIRRR